MDQLILRAKLRPGLWLNNILFTPKKNTFKIFLQRLSDSLICFLLTFNNDWKIAEKGLVTDLEFIS